ncbi:hypothetical protein SAMN04488074_14314 [Lentzea albidocapillata subsp. violacea]|uniref:Uncharacterized protein n=1 Tax=Lentzea albidocapillata subsp. violacea TaxID=128104 RepID=A0A1H0A2V2_9PSEU|nr:hypothetical protein SAMN04488074_14314 [Lentzea albidocapillata subsp. violacea]
MWAWFVGGAILLVALLLTYTGHKAASAATEQQRADAYRVFLALLVAAIAVCFLLAMVVQQAGVL